MQRRPKAVTPPFTPITPFSPNFTLPWLTGQQCCEWLHRQEDLLQELQHPESYDGPPDWDPQVQFILASNPSTVHERDHLDCVEIFLEEIVLQAATLQQEVLYVYGHVHSNAYFIKLNEQE
jgi:hypothetical protein